MSTRPAPAFGASSHATTVSPPPHATTGNAGLPTGASDTSKAAEPFSEWRARTAAFPSRDSSHAAQNPPVASAASDGWSRMPLGSKATGVSSSSFGPIANAHHTRGPPSRTSFQAAANFLPSGETATAGADIGQPSSFVFFRLRGVIFQNDAPPSGEPGTTS